VKRPRWPSPLPKTGEFKLREPEIRRGIDQLTQLLTAAALDAATDRKAKFTDEERNQLRRQSGILSAAVAELRTLADHPRKHVRAHRLITLFGALGATTFIASHAVKSRALDRLRAASGANKNVQRRSSPKKWHDATASAQSTKPPRANSRISSANEQERR
jgi:hypothetical protein